MKDINQWTRKEFEALRSRDWCEDIGEFFSLVILPMRHKHDSGYRCMDFVAVDKDGIPMCRLSGCSDVIHIDGIGGYGKWQPETGIPSMVQPKSWSIDCLMTSGLLRIFTRGMLTAGHALSSMEIYSTKPS